MIICDSSPLIHITKIGKLRFILTLFKEIYITQGVYREVIEKGREKSYSDAEIISYNIEEKKIIVMPIKEEIESLKAYLHEGEYESIVLAKNNNALLIIDERKARKIATQYKIATISTSSLLLLILKNDIIDYSLFESNYSNYCANGWLSLDVYNRYMNKAMKHKKLGVN